MSDIEHTFQKFGEELNTLKAEVLRMGELARSQVARAMDAVARQDEASAHEVCLRDEALDGLRREIEEEAIRLMALRNPMAQDLRRTIAAIKIGSILERIGDFAKNTARRGVVPAGQDVSADPLWTRLGDIINGFVGRGPADAALLDRHSRLFEEISALIHDRLGAVLDAYANDKAGQAEEVWRGDGQIDELYLKLFGEIINAMGTDQRCNSLCVTRLFIVKNLERVGDYVASIAEIVYYELTGERLELISQRSE